ncbi:hypothetical protein ABZ307_22950 [Streptomyces griseorubiginosus]|uniref:hypothetical protein n=1 Tax=Streptomyces griseorubiginosus TaxID=67304 RepID=UPI0033BABCB9
MGIAVAALVTLVRGAVAAPVPTVLSVGAFLGIGSSSPRSSARTGIARFPWRC